MNLKHALDAGCEMVVERGNISLHLWKDIDGGGEEHYYHRADYREGGSTIIGGSYCPDVFWAIEAIVEAHVAGRDVEQTIKDIASGRLRSEPLQGL